MTGAEQINKETNVTTPVGTDSSTTQSHQPGGRAVWGSPVESELSTQVSPSLSSLCSQQNANTIARLVYADTPQGCSRHQLMTPRGVLTECGRHPL